MSDSESVNRACPKCGSEMEFGLLIDSTHRSGKLLEVTTPEQVQEWVRGSPRKSIMNLAFKTEPGDRLQVATLRCTKCGFLELYAR